MKRCFLIVMLTNICVMNLLFISCVSKPGFEGKGDLCGLVIDENNKPVKDFLVCCKPVNEKFCLQEVKPVITNESGLFVFYGLSSGDYFLSGTKKTYMRIEPVYYSFDDRTKIICIQTKSFQAAMSKADELLRLGQAEEAYALLDNIDYEKDSKEGLYINALKFHAAKDGGKKRIILAELKNNSSLKNKENDFIKSYTEKLEEIMEWKKSDVENH